jgi:hypothetical protein
MARSPQTTDTVVKLLIAVSGVILYFTKLITGPFAIALLTLSIIVVVVFVVKALYMWLFRD